MNAGRTRTTRRGLLQAGACGGIAAAGFGAFGFATSPALAAADRVTIPAGPMRLGRILERDLAGGASLSVERTWRIEFTRRGQGIAIAGEQLSADVAAPPHLAALAQIEKQRPTASLWPILLSEAGAILAAGSTMRGEDIAAALKAAERIIAERALPASEAARHQAFLDGLQQASGSLLEQMPADLFYPRGEPVRRIESVSLPGGMAGEFELAYLARPASGGKWLASATREIVTRVEGEERSARESWRMEPD